MTSSWPRWPLYSNGAGDLLPVNELLAARYRAHLAVCHSAPMALLLAERDVAGYLRFAQAERTELYESPPGAYDWLFGSMLPPGGLA